MCYCEMLFCKLQDQRCSICGHKGKGNSFRLPRYRGSDRNLHFESFDVTSATTEKYSQHVTRWSALSTLAMLMRRDIFMIAQKVPEELEFDAHESEPTTRHVLGLIGDGPVAYARWRLATIGGNNVALFDRLCVKEPYRTRGVARAGRNSQGSP